MRGPAYSDGATGVRVKSRSETLTPRSFGHTLRHTFLRKVDSRHGVEFAMQAAGHASTSYIWRWVKPSDEQTGAALEDLF